MGVAEAEAGAMAAAEAEDQRLANASALRDGAWPGVEEEGREESIGLLAPAFICVAWPWPPTPPPPPPSLPAKLPPPTLLLALVPLDRLGENAGHGWALLAFVLPLLLPVEAGAAWNGTELLCG